MVATPEIRYARSGGLDIAYEVRGSGPIDVVYIPGFISHLDLYRDLPAFETAIARIERFARVIVLDKRGTGLSSRDLGFGSVAERMDDIRAVMDDAGWERANVIGASEGGPLSILFAATYPDRVSRLALFGTYAHLDTRTIRPDFDADRYLAWLERSWGTGVVIAQFIGAQRDTALRPRLARYERGATTPQLAREIMRCNLDIDVRDFLPAVTVPVLIAHVTGDPIVPVAQAREMAAALPNATFVEVPGDVHFPRDVREWAPVLDETEKFLTGARPVSGEPDRVLATVLFTDIVGSTDQAARVGDTQWRALLDAHDRHVTDTVERFGGRVVKFTGDGALATFDGPARAVRAARAVLDDCGALGLPLRAGLHTGEVERRGDDVGGIAVHIAARVAALAGDGEVLASRTVRDLVVGSDLSFEDRGVHDLKGVPEPWQLYAARG